MFNIPSLLDLLARSRSSFRANLPGSDAWVWPNNVGPTAKVVAGAANELFGFADNVQRQKFALTADGQNLDRHGAELGLSRKPAAPAQGGVNIVVADAFAVVNGAILQRLDGVQYVATAAVSTGGAGTLSVPVQAVKDGAITNAVAGTPLALISGFTDVHGDAAALATVDPNGIALGADVEADGAYFNPPPGTYRARILFRKRYPPHGGAAHDYVMWGTDVTGFSRIYVERLWNSVGTVRVFGMMDDVYPDGIPQPADIARLADHIEALRPSGAMVTYAAPTALPINITVANLFPNTTATQNAVLAELRASFRRLNRVAGIDTRRDSMPFLATPAQWNRLWTDAAISNAPGVQSADVNAPVGDTTVPAGQIATLGTVTFV